MVIFVKREFFKELENSLSALDLSGILTAAIENTRRGEASTDELLDAVKAAHPEIPLLQDTRLTADLFADYLDTYYNISGDYIEYYAYWSPEGGISKKSQ